MKILMEVISDIFGMFVADARLTCAILAVVAVAAGLIDLAGAPPLIGGAVLLLGCLGTMIGAVLRTASQKRAAQR